ncbi:MAG: hypothetical protein WA960_03670 [Tunicatimonas sp.]
MKYLNYFLLFFLLSAQTVFGQLTAGVATTNITPALGAPMEGYYFARPATGVHDDLFAKAVVLNDGSTTVAIVILDLVDVAQTAFDEAREQIERELGIPRENIIVSATHTHTGPLFTPEYKSGLASKIVDAVQIAAQRQQPVVIKSGVEQAEGVAFHRRFMMKDSTVRFNPGYENPDIVRPMGPVDPEVGILKIESLGGETLAILVNFAIHLDTIGGTEISADFPVFLTEILQRMYGPQAVVFFALGTCGNINHINVAQQDTLEGFQRSERIGHALAASVIRASPALTKAESRQLKVGHQPVFLRTPTYTEAQVAEARVNAQKESDKEASTPEIREAMKILRVDGKQGQPWEVEVQTIGLGDIGIVALPGEIFVELGLAIKEQSPYQHTFIFTLANNDLGYVPNEAAYPYGAYEVEVSNIAPGEGEKLVATAVTLLKTMKE